MLELLTLVCWAATLGIQALGVGTQQARVVVAISIVVPMATAAPPLVVVMVLVVVMAAYLLALEIKLNNSHGFGSRWLLQLCIFSQANKLLKLAKGVAQEQTENARNNGDKGLESAASKPVEYYTKENGQDPTRDHLKNTHIDKSFLVTFSLAN